MTTLLHDAHASFRARTGQDIPTAEFVRELVYADDTLLIDSEAENLEMMMQCVADSGQEYGLSYNWSKLEVLCVRCSADIRQPNGKIVKKKDSIVYLGALITCDGRSCLELNRRIGLARADFSTLQTIWGHSTLSRQSKLQIFQACIVSRLLYALPAATLNAAERKRLDAFQAWCLRKIAHIPHSYYSRVSNFTVRALCAQAPLSQQVAQQQMIYMGKLARRSGNDIVRSLIFEPNSLTLRQPNGKRRRGRPRQQWGPTVLAKCAEVAGSQAKLAEFFCAQDGADQAWKRVVNESFI